MSPDAQEQSAAALSPAPNAALLRSLLRCPACHMAGLTEAADHLACAGCGSAYPVTRGRPVMMRPDNPLFSAQDYLGATEQVGKPGLGRLVPSLSLNLSSDKCITRLAGMLPDDARILIVGAGIQRGWLDPKLSAGTRTIIYSDVDVRAAVDLFCDGHDLPFADASFDAVVTTAVLEHVLYPERVAAEITRVLRVGGLLYSELPFMQQVHEGAFDFTRFTLSGHRRLFNAFEEVDAGMVAGPGTVLAWSWENFILAFARGARTRKILKGFGRFAFGWLKYFDYLLKDRAEAMDGASCTYLLGRRSERRVSDVEIIQSYVGGKPMSHT